MKKLFIVLAFALFGLTHLFAQNQTDSIEIRISAGINYYQNGNKLTQKQLLSIMKTDEKAYDEMITAKSNSNVATVLGAAGGFLVGYQIGKRITGNYPNGIWTIAGGVLIIVSIPIIVHSGKQARNAVRLYNSGLKQSAFRKVDYKIGLSSNGLGVSMRF